MMRRFLIYLAAALLLAAACRPAQEPRVTARAVPERADDFMFENNLICGRIYGQALEGNPTSPGIDIWVKLPGALVADDWYAAALEDPAYYHHDHGGKDCYKVAVSLGGGASVPFIDGRLCYPATNYRSWEMVEQQPDCLAFRLRYPRWEAAEGIFVELEKTVTVRADSYFCEVRDLYTFTGTDSLTVAAGIKLHGDQQTVESRLEGTDRLAIWEHASDQGVEPEEGMIGVAVVCPSADAAAFFPDLDHGLLMKKIASGAPFCYLFGSCWSKGDLHTAAEWFAQVRAQVPETEVDNHKE